MDENKKQEVVPSGKGAVSKKHNSILGGFAEDFVQKTVVPKSKRVAVDLMDQLGVGLLDMAKKAIFGDFATSTKSTSSVVDRKSYERYYGDRVGTSNIRRATVRSSYDVVTPEFDSFGDANEAKMIIEDWLTDHPNIEVGRAYSFCFDKMNMPPENHLDWCYGWTDFSGAKIKTDSYRGEDRWLLIFPPTEYLR